MQILHTSLTFTTPDLTRHSSIHSPSQNKVKNKPYLILSHLLMCSILLLLVVSLEPVQGCLFVQGCSLLFLLLEQRHLGQLLLMLGMGLLEVLT